MFLLTPLILFTASDDRRARRDHGRGRLDRTMAMALIVEDQEPTKKAKGRGGARPGAGRKPGRFEGSMETAKHIDGTLEEIKGAIDSVPLLVRLLVGRVLGEIAALASQMAPLIFQLAGHLRLLQHQLQRLEAEYEWQAKIRREAEARLESRIALLEEMIARLEAELVGARLEAKELMAAHLAELQRIRGTVIRIPTAIPEKEIGNAVERACENALQAMLPRINIHTAGRTSPSTAVRRPTLSLPPPRIASPNAPTTATFSGAGDGCPATPTA